MGHHASPGGNLVSEPGTLGYVRINILGFAITGLWSSLSSIVLPLILLDLVSGSQKNTYLGLITFAGLIVAMLVQPVVGALSDRSRFSWGRRRPFIVVGICVAVLFIPGIGFAQSLAILLAAYCLLGVATNTAQSAFQAFIAEMVPKGARGRASGVKGLLEVLGGVALVRLVAFFMDRYFAGGGEHWLWWSLAVLAGVLLGAMLITVLTVQEQPGHLARQVTRVFSEDRHPGNKGTVERGFILFLVWRGLTTVPGVALQLFALYYIMEAIGIDRPVAVFGDLLVVVGVCLLAAAYPAGRVSDRLGRRPVVAFSGLLGAAGIVSLLFANCYTHLVISGALLGISNGTLISGGWALATDLVPRGEEARYLAFTNSAIVVGSALARLIGPAIDFFNGFSFGLGYRVMLFVCLTCFVVGVLLVLKIRLPSVGKQTPI